MSVIRLITLLLVLLTIGASAHESLADHHGGDKIGNGDNGGKTRN